MGPLKQTDPVRQHEIDTRIGCASRCEVSGECLLQHELVAACGPLATIFHFASFVGLGQPLGERFGAMMKLNTCRERGSGSRSSRKKVSTPVDS